MRIFMIHQSDINSSADERGFGGFTRIWLRLRQSFIIAIIATLAPLPVSKPVTNT